MNDLHFAVRSLAKSPGYSLATLLTLALGIGSAAAIFSATDRVLFRRLPYPAPDQLMVLGYKSKRFDFLGSQLPIQFATYREHARSFRSFAALETRWVTLVVNGDPFGVSLGRASLDYFSTLGAIPLIGRTFVPGEDQPGADNVVVLGHRLWRERFAGNKDVVGRDVLIAGVSCRIIGVLPPDFTPPQMHHADVYQPLVLRPNPAQPFGSYLYVVGRLQPDVNAAQAQAELATIKPPVSGRAAEMLAEREVRLVPLAEQMRPRTATAYWAMLAGVGFLYAIACANATNLMFARLHGRRKELSVRLAIGCGLARLIRLIAVENLIVTVAAGTLGVLVAQWIFPALVWLAPTALESWHGATLDWRVLGFAGALTVFTGLIVSLPIAWQLAVANVVEGLKEGAQTVGESRRLRHLRGGLVIGEAALAVVLLVGAGLMVRSVQRLQRIDRGFDPTNKVAVLLQHSGNLANPSYATPEARRQFYERLEEQFRAIPGVQGVSITAIIPMAGRAGGTLTKPDGTELWAGHNPVSPGYRQTLALPLRKGRWFDNATPGSDPVVVINETMARDYFGEDNPIGKLFTLGSGAVPWQVIGIVGDIREQPKEKPRPQYYYPYWQRPGGQITSVLLRLTKPADAALGDAVRRAVFAVDPLMATLPLRPLEEAAAAQIAQERYTLSVLEVLSALALGLAVAGLFAVMAYTVAQRMGEFGVRLAFGAVPAQLFRMVLVRGIRLAVIGIIIGMALACGLTRFLQSLLYETSAGDLLTHGIVAVVLLAAALLGCWVPARRATRASVAQLLRAE